MVARFGIAFLRQRRLEAFAIGKRYTHSSTSPSIVHEKGGLILPKVSPTRLFPFRWLRDACQCPDCVHPSTKQKLIKTSDIPMDIKPVAVSMNDAQDSLRISWSNSKVSKYPLDFLQKHSSPATIAQESRLQHLWQLWDARTLQTQATDFSVGYESLQKPQGLLNAINQLSAYGLLLVQGVPHGETADQECELPRLAQKFGQIRDTFYGRVWDVKNVKNSRNIAYTNLDLGLHMDLLYFQHPPQYQILHCLRNKVSGGASIFVDSAYVAEVLRKNHPDAFRVLSEHPISFHYENDGHLLYHEHPTIELDPFTDRVRYINYSPPFQAPLPVDTPEEVYQALALFAEMLNDEANTMTFTLKEGEAVLFDNRRVLHARTAFEELPGNAEGQANRWLKGCYIEGDAVWDRRRVLATDKSLRS